MEVQLLLMNKVAEAKVHGYSDGFASDLQRIPLMYQDCSRVRLENDPLGDLPPLEMRLEDGAKPVQCKARRYPLAHSQSMREHLNELVVAGLCYRNPQSPWSSLPLIFKKPGIEKVRMTMDVRVVNA